MVDSGDHCLRAPSRCHAHCRKKRAGANQPQHRRGKWGPKNLHLRRNVTVDGQKDDVDPNAPPIQTTTFQIIDETEELPAQQTSSLERRWRQATNLFQRRCFTNGPLKGREVERQRNGLSFQPCALPICLSFQQCALLEKSGQLVAPHALAKSQIPMPRFSFFHAQFM